MLVYVVLWRVPYEGDTYLGLAKDLVGVRDIIVRNKWAFGSEIASLQIDEANFGEDRTLVLQHDEWGSRVVIVREKV